MEDGVVRVNYAISLTNDDPNTYIAKYTLSTGLNEINNVTAQLDSGLSLAYEVRTTDETKSIEVSFPQPNSPQTTINWNLSFTTTSPIEKVGKNWEVIVPGFVEQTDLTVVVKIPKSVGSANYFSSSPGETRDDGNKLVYIFSGSSVSKSGIFISFGSEQVYKFTYKYELRNDNEDTRLRATVTLPPDYKNQKIYYEEISPSPNSGYRDVDGNSIAEYLLEPGEEFEVEITGKAIISSELDNDFEPPVLDLDRYLTSDTYWEVDNEQIKELAASLTKDLGGDREKAKAVYDYVVENLNYSQTALTDTERGRLGAAKSLQDTDDVICQEFTDLFIALARAAGIPARMLAGYTTAGAGYELPENTLHAWAEFYTENEGWVTVDPTWESTSEGFDFFSNVGLNHFVLAIRGASSETPHLVLSFIPGDDTSDNLNIETSDEVVEMEKEISVNYEIPDQIHTLFPTPVNIVVTNNSNRILSYLNFSALESNVKISLPEIDAQTAIFPQSSQTFELSILPRTYFGSSFEDVEFTFSALQGENDTLNKKETLTLQITPHRIITYGFIIFALILTALIVGGGYVVVRKVKWNRMESKKPS